MQKEDSIPLEPVRDAHMPAHPPAPATASASSPPIKRSRSGLSAIQELALEHLTSGVSIADAARAARVDRRTLHRWIRDDARFAAAYNAWRQEVIDSARARVTAMSNRALDTMNAAMERGDVRVALQVAKATGALDPQQPGATHAALLRRQRSLQENQEGIELKKAEEQVHRYHRARKDDEAWMKDVDSMAGLLDGLIRQFKQNLDAEPPEERTKRRTSYNSYSRTHRLLELLLNDHAYAKAFDQERGYMDIKPPADLSPTWPPPPDWVPPAISPADESAPSAPPTPAATDAAPDAPTAPASSAALAPPHRPDAASPAAPAVKALVTRARPRNYDPNTSDLTDQFFGYEPR